MCLAWTTWHCDWHTEERPVNRERDDIWKMSPSVVQATVHPLDLLQPWGSRETCLACELRVMRSSASLLGPDPGRTWAYWLLPAQSPPSIPAVTPTPSLQPHLFCHNEHFKASALLLTPLSTCSNHGSRVPNVLRDARDEGVVTTASGPTVPRRPVQRWSCWISIRSNLRSLEPTVTWGLAVWGSQGPWNRPHGHLSPAWGTSAQPWALQSILEAPVLQLWLPITTLPPMIPVGE